MTTATRIRTPAEENHLTLGARMLLPDACRFRVWAPKATTVELILVDPARRPLPMKPIGSGHYECIVDAIAPDQQYLYCIDGTRDFPDPASRRQPRGVHGPSAIVDHRFDWNNPHFRGIELADAVFYELHVGTFTETGTFESAIDDLDRLVELGVTMIQVMPVAAFPGSRNWGYDGVFPFAVQESYGGPAGFRRFIDACHQRGLGVALDVVYNHLGPEGNVLDNFGHYFTDKYHTPWGRAINFDDQYCDETRAFFIQNALSWIIDYRIDALRLDAVHAIFDQSAEPFLKELAQRVHATAAQLGRTVLVIAESDLNDPRLIRDAASGGFGLDGQWSDDVHHALHALVSGESDGYYADFGRLADLAKAIERGYVYDGQYSAYRRRRHGAPTDGIPAERFVICSQNHDQVGNRMLGERLPNLVSYEMCKVIVAAVLLSPMTPLLFMGEEYAETAPFLYFVSHGDEQLVRAVQDGRRREFESFNWRGEVPDPQSPATFKRSRLDRTRRRSTRARAMEAYYRCVLSLRRELQRTRLLARDRQIVTFDEDRRVMWVLRSTPGGGPGAMLCFNFGEQSASIEISDEGARWRKVIDSAAVEWEGPGSTVPDAVGAPDSVRFELPASSFVLYLAEHGSAGRNR